MAVAEILEEVRGLSLEDQAKIAGDIWARLGEDAPGRWEDEAALYAELERRAADLDSGKVQGVPHEEVMRSLHAIAGCK